MIRNHIQSRWGIFKASYYKYFLERFSLDLASRVLQVLRSRKLIAIGLNISFFLLGKNSLVAGLAKGSPLTSTKL